MFTTSGTYPWSFVTSIFYNNRPNHGDDHTTVEVMTSTLPIGTLGSVASYKLRDIYSICTAVMLVVKYINGKFTMRTFKSSLLS
jgi:hypothetical protein